MSLINCPECGKQISDTSGFCIKCGFDIKSYLKQLQKKEEIKNNYKTKIDEINRMKRPDTPSLSEIIFQDKMLGHTIIIFVSVLFFALFFMFLFFGRFDWFTFILMILGIIFSYMSIKEIKHFYQTKLYEYEHFEEYKKSLKEKVEQQYNFNIEFLNEYGCEKLNQNIINNKPKCPICQSTNIKKISNTKRVVYGASFGLFSKTARSQWICNNCGNKW